MSPDPQAIGFCHFLSAWMPLQMTAAQIRIVNHRFELARIMCPAVVPDICVRQF
jgi:hypothetical protein